MRKTIEKTTKETKKEVKTELKDAFVLWRNESKKGTKYLKGYTTFEGEQIKLVGYFNGLKKNPKEPDVRVYSIDSDSNLENEVASLWDNVGKGNTRYLTGTTDEKEKLVAFYGKENEEARPYIRAYFSKEV